MRRHEKMPEVGTPVYGTFLLDPAGLMVGSRGFVTWSEGYYGREYSRSVKLRKGKRFGKLTGLFVTQITVPREAGPCTPDTTAGGGSAG